ncbi:oligosaccharide flippase family protein, partial [Clostridium saudiense]|nr:oligosaccharide flippase family protein [Clostridium saudiense]
MSSRIVNSMRNTIYAFMSQGITSILSFFTRTVFIYTLGKTYLGLNGLFSDILTLLSLAELGVGTAITYSMYKPMAQNDKRKVSALLNLYSNIYTIIGIVVTILGLALTPFLSFFISDMPNVANLKIIYLLYLLNTTLSYFFVYKQSMLIASQQIYIVSKVQIVATVLQNIFQIIILIMFKNFIFYLVIQVIFVVLTNTYISIYVDKKFKYLKEYKSEKLDQQTKKHIYKNVSAMFLSKISSAVVTSTDNILISKYVSTIVLGYYSNYTLFFSLLIKFFTLIFFQIFKFLIYINGNIC